MTIQLKLNAFNVNSRLVGSVSIISDWKGTSVHGGYVGKGGGVHGNCVWE